MTKPIRLTDNQIQNRLQALKNWSLVQGRLYAEFKFANFIEAFGFMTKIAIIAQSMDHHPEWSNAYNKVRIYLVTPEINGISERDFDLARQINKLVGEEAWC